MEIKDVRKQIDKKLLEYRRLVSSYKREGENLQREQKRLENAEEARAVIQEVAKQIQQQAHEQISSVVTRGLQSVFDDPYIFKIIFDKKRGRTEARLIFEREEDGLELDPLTASGGGVIDVASFALRISCILLSRPPIRPVLILDEPFKNVSKARDYLDRIPSLLETLCNDLGIQIIMDTHIDELKMGTIIEVG